MIWQPVREYASMFRIEDFIDIDKLAKKLSDPNDPVSKYIRTQLKEKTTQYLDIQDDPSFHLTVFAHRLKSDFNDLLNNPVLSSAQPFRGFRLPAEVDGFDSQDDLFRINRLLLEIAYPDEIAKSRRIDGLAAEIVHFFWDVYALDEGEPHPRTLYDFVSKCPSHHRRQHPNLGLEIRRSCHNLIAEGLLFSVGFNPAQKLPYSEQFLSYFFNEEFAEYGSYEFVAFGFPSIHERFSNSIIKFVISESGKEKDNIGTGFLMESGKIVTAAHCLPEGATIRIEGWDATTSHVSRIVTLGQYLTENPFLLTRGKVDIAVIEFDVDPFPNAPKLRLWGDSVLDDVLVLGYPLLSGFQSGLIAAKGQIISKELSTARNQPLIIFSASVKGGNSGGPVINRVGKVVGLVTNLLPKQDRDIYKLGYGLATPAQPILDLISLARGREIKDKDKEIFQIEFATEGNTIKLRS